MRDDLEEAGEDASDDEGVAEVEVVEAGEVIDNVETSQSSEGKYKDFLAYVMPLVNTNMQ